MSYFRCQSSVGVPFFVVGGGWLCEAASICNLWDNIVLQGWKETSWGDCPRAGQVSKSVLMCCGFGWGEASLLKGRENTA